MTVAPTSRSQKITITGNCNAVGRNNKVQCLTVLFSLPPNTGVLVAAHDVRPPYANDCAPADSDVVLLGRNIAYTDNVFWSSGIVAMRGDVMLAIGEGQNGIFVSRLKIFDEQGRIIVNVDETGFWVAQFVRTERPDPSTLIVYDEHDREALHLRIMNQKTISVSGIFRHPDMNAVYVPPIDPAAIHFGVCASGAKIAMFGFG